MPFEENALDVKVIIHLYSQSWWTLSECQMGGMGNAVESCDKYIFHSMIKCIAYVWRF